MDFETLAKRLGIQMDVSPREEMRKRVVGGLRKDCFEKVTETIFSVLNSKQITHAAEALSVAMSGAEASLATVAGLVVDGIADPSIPAKKRSELGETNDAFLFGALLCFYSQQSTKDSGDLPGNNIEAAHATFQLITGRIFRDVFLRTCDCAACDERRAKLGVEKIR